MHARPAHFLIALLLVLCCSPDNGLAQGRTRRSLADQIGERMPEEIFRAPYNAVVTELILPAGSVPGVTIPFPVTRVRYAAVPFFAFDSASLSPQSRATTQNIATLFKELREIAGIVIVGHTDSVGAVRAGAKLHH